MIGFWEISVFLLAMYLTGAVAIASTMRYLTSHNLVHEVHWMLLASFVCYFIGSMLHLIFYSEYRENGVGNEGVEIFARCFEVIRIWRVGCGKDCEGCERFAVPEMMGGV